MTNIVTFRTNSRPTTSTAAVRAVGPLRRVESADFDIYSGRAADLVSAGLTAVHELPGQPDRPKRTVTYLADGTAAPGGRAQLWKQAAGGRRIERTGADRFEVSVVVPEPVREQRRAEFQAIFASVRQACRPQCLSQRLDSLQQRETERQQRVLLRLRRQHLALVPTAGQPV